MHVEKIFSRIITFTPVTPQKAWHSSLCPRDIYMHQIQAAPNFAAARGLKSVSEVPVSEDRESRAATNSSFS